MVALSHQSCGKAQREIVVNFMFIIGKASKLSYWNYLVFDSFNILVNVDWYMLTMITLIQRLMQYLYILYIIKLPIIKPVAFVVYFVSSYV